MNILLKVSLLLSLSLSSMTYASRVHDEDRNPNERKRLRVEGATLDEEMLVHVTDISKNNRIIVGTIQEPYKIGLPFMAVLPPRLFDKQ
ncbi:MAG: hypothetical protein ACTHJ4_04470 [Candidatus Nucleicultricaceae bacterium]